ncbi:uncharacterized protein LOC105287139 isoform X2 [Ooceraea biroi]|uniref:uncharacterized protein LOC105287139 isoform X2 n=1 Tax=Ooceraea biroi TaxID=2015173 RepID=UPI0005BA00C6|nr:uncharacterized protein LOC105287139 isoform X2 [Ooceraea biroi]
MDFTEEHYKLNRILLLWLGLWPYDTSFFKKIQIVFFEALFISFVLCQFNVLLVKNCSIVLVMRICMFLFIISCVIINYNAGLLLTHTFKYVFNRIRYDWKILKNQAEFEIIQKYADKTKFYTISFALLGTSGCLGVLSLSFVSPILDVIIPMNVSRSLRLPIVAEYFVDQTRYFYPIMIHIFIVSYVCLMTLVAIIALLIAYVMHNCAIFEIVSYRLEHMFDEKILEMSKDIREHILYERLVHAVYLHRRATDMANIMTNSYANFYMIFLIIGIGSTTFSVFHFFYVLEALNDVIEIITSSAIIVFQFYYIFIANYMGQNIIDISVNLFQTTYNTEWYAAPLWLQKLILFIMQRSSIKSTFTTAGVFDASLEGFAKRYLL